MSLTVSLFVHSDVIVSCSEIYVSCIVGFETAVDEAQRAINAAYVEAKSFPDCIGVVKLSTLCGAFRDTNDAS